MSIHLNVPNRLRVSKEVKILVGGTSHIYEVPSPTFRRATQEILSAEAVQEPDESTDESVYLHLGESAASFKKNKHKIPVESKSLSQNKTLKKTNTKINN